MVLRILLILIALSSISCASSTFYVYDEEQKKFIPETKMTNRGMGVTADHKNKKLSNKILEIPDIEFDK